LRFLISRSSFSEVSAWWSRIGVSENFEMGMKIAGLNIDDHRVAGIEGEF